MMDAGGSPFPHNEGASVDGGTEVVTSTVVSGAFSSDLMGGSSVLGPISPGLASGNVIIPPYGMSRTLVSCHRCFLELLLSYHSAMSEFEVDSHSRQLHGAGISLCFPLVFASERRRWSAASALWQCFLSVELLLK